MRDDDIRCNIYHRLKNQPALVRAAASRSERARSRSFPRWPSCLRCATCTGSSRRARSFSPSGDIRALTTRRSLFSRQRRINPRFSRRSRSRVMSGSRVIIRQPISPQGSPSGEPRRIRSTLYWVADRSSLLRTWAGLRERRSQVRSRSRNAVSSGLLFGLSPTFI